jgi:hypothetical protein
VRTRKEDIALIGEAGWWKGERDPVYNAVLLLCMFAKRPHRPARNLHELADAIERGNAARAAEVYTRLVEEVQFTLPKYPEIEDTLARISEMKDTDLATADRLMQREF